MKCAALLAAGLATVTAFAPSKTAKVTTSLQEKQADLVAIAEKCNPVVKFYDPLGLSEANFWGMGEEATIGFLRHSELKHGRIAMFAFVGYIVHSNFHFPWPQTLHGDMPPSVDLSPAAQWDAIPALAKIQIMILIFCLEAYDESGGGGQLPHYMSGRKPGQYPTFQPFRDNVHFILDLYDPAGLSKNRSAEAKERGLIAEINNGRLAMIGIFGFVSEDVVPGSVPGILGGVGLKGYDGEIMAPFTNDYTFFG